MKKILSFTLFLTSLVCSASTSFANEKEHNIVVIEDTFAAIFYPSPICMDSDSVNVTITGTGNYLGGTFSSVPGLFINSVTGQIIPYASTPGIYVVTYSIPAGPNNPAIDATYTVTLTAAVVPAFNAIAPICYGSNSPILPSVSNDGISGMWLPSAINNTISSSYTFTPTPGQCAVSTAIFIDVIQSNPSVIISNNGSNTVYVDEITNDVVSPLMLSSETEEGNYTYQWFQNNVPIANATANTYIINTPTTNGEDRIFKVETTNINTGCSNLSADFVVLQSNGVPLPGGETDQTLPTGSTLFDVVVSGTNIQWYASTTGRSVSTGALPLSTVLIDNTTYYASQTINGNESVERLPVTVHLTLGIEEHHLASLILSPNPVKNNLTITTKTNAFLNSANIYNTLGQLVQVSANPGESIDVSGLQNGSYFIKITSDKGSATGKFIKE